MQPITTKQIGTLVAAFTVLANLCFWYMGIPTTVTCSVARAWSTAYAAATSTE